MLQLKDFRSLDKRDVNSAKLFLITALVSILLLSIITAVFKEFSFF